MLLNKLVYVMWLAVFLCLCRGGLADVANDRDAEIEKLRQEMVELRRVVNQIKQTHDAEIEELKKEHRSEIKALKEKIDAHYVAESGPSQVTEVDETDYLRQLAESMAKEEDVEATDATGETVFRSGGLSLQALNPELSVTGDMLGYYRHQDGTRERSDFLFRELGLHFEAYLDPYSRFKAAVPINEDGAELGEAYYSRYGVFDGVNLALGKFRQQFGVVNRWHKHALDQVDFPLALREIFGEGGLNQTGASVDWILPSDGETSQEVTFQVTDSSNDRMFGGDTLGNPCLLVHYKNYRDVSDDTYLEFGLSSLFGWNDEWDVGVDKEHDTLGTQVFGGDFTVNWEPADRMRYRNVEWRSEVYLLNRDILAPDGSGRDSLNAWGAYSYVQSKVSRTVDVGVRGDYYQPDNKDYADFPGASLMPLAYTEANAYRWQVGPYVTWHQSPFVKFRCEFDHIDGRKMENAEDVVWVQMIFAAGPHKHERY